MKAQFLRLSAASILLWLTLLANMVEAAPRMVMAFLGDWNQAQRYRKGDVVAYDDALYQSLKGNNLNTAPGADAVYWRRILGGSRTPDCKNPGMASNLIGCEYATGNKLRGKDLRGAQLIKAKLTGDLGTVNLEGANLTGATFGVSDEKEPPSGSSLTLQGGTEGSTLANLRGANLSNSVTANGFPIQASFVEFSSANLTGIIWHSANLEGAWMTHTTLIHAQLLECNCAAASMAYADLRSAVLWNAKMNGAVLYSANLSRAQLSGADVSNADFSYANMAHASLNPDTNVTNLAGANFTGADLTGVNFTDATGGDSVIYDSTTRFEGAICPDGSKVNGTNIPNCQGHGFGAPQ